MRSLFRCAPVYSKGGSALFSLSLATCFATVSRISCTGMSFSSTPSQSSCCSIPCQLQEGPGQRQLKLDWYTRRRQCPACQMQSKTVGCTHIMACSPVTTFQPASFAICANSVQMSGW